MKNTKFTLLGIYILIFAFVGCNKSDDINASDYDLDIPVIQLAWSKTLTLTSTNDTIKFIPQIRKSNQFTYKWIYGGKEIATTKDIAVKIQEPTKGTELEFQVLRNNEKINYRKTMVSYFDSKRPIFNYTGENEQKIVEAFLNPGQSISNIRWNEITHLVLSSIEVNETSDDVLISKLGLGEGKELKEKLDKIVLLAHSKGIRVIISLTPSFQNRNSANYRWGQRHFYNKLSDETKRSAIITQTINFMNEYNMDGINVYLNESSQPTEIDPNIITPFFTEMGEKIKELNNKSFSVSGLAGWTRTAFAPLASISTIDWVDIFNFTAENQNFGSHFTSVSFADAKTELEAWENQGFEKSKLVLGISASSISYDLPDDLSTVTWANNWEYISWGGYKDVLDRDDKAYEKNQLGVTNNEASPDKIQKGTFFNGSVLAEEKAQGILDNGYGGVFIWSVGNDATSNEASINHAVAKKLIK